MKLRYLMMSLVAVICMMPISWGQEANQTAAQETLEKIKSEIENRDWDAVFQSMTDAGKDEFCVEQVMITGSFLQMVNMGPGIPGMGDQADKIKEIFAETKLDEIELPEGGCGPQGCPDPAAMMEKMEAAEISILKLLKESGRQVEIAGSLYDALSDIPMSPQAFAGELVSAEADENLVLLRVGSEMMPDRFLKFEKNGDQFLYSGIDQMRTMQAMQEFMQDMMKNGMGPGMQGPPGGFGPQGGVNPDDF